MRKKLAVILCTAMTVTALAGCGQSGQTAQENSGASQENAQEQEEAGEEPAEEQADAQPSGDVLTIEFFQQKGEEGPQKGYQAIIDKFNAENPDIVIEMNTVPDAGTVLTSRISSGDIPVIFSDYPTQMQSGSADYLGRVSCGMRYLAGGRHHANGTVRQRPGACGTYVPRCGSRMGA